MCALLFHDVLDHNILDRAGRVRAGHLQGIFPDIANLVYMAVAGLLDDQPCVPYGYPVVIRRLFPFRCGVVFNRCNVFDLLAFQCRVLEEHIILDEDLLAISQVRVCLNCVAVILCRYLDVGELFRLFRACTEEVRLDGIRLDVRAGLLDVVRYHYISCDCAFHPLGYGHGIMAGLANRVVGLIGNLINGKVAAIDVDNILVFDPSGVGIMNNLVRIPEACVCPGVIIHIL